MRNQKFYVYSIAAILFASISSISASRQLFVPAAALGFGTIGLGKIAAREANFSGRTDRMKLFSSLSNNISELLIVSGLLILPQVPKILSVWILLLLALEKGFQADLKRKVMNRMSLRFGRDLRLGLASTVLLVSFFNSYSVYWGSLLLGFSLVYDTGYLVYTGFSEA